MLISMLFLTFQRIVMHSFSGSRRLRLPDTENERKVGNYSTKDTASHPQRLEATRTICTLCQYRTSDGRGGDNELLHSYTFVGAKEIKHITYRQDFS
jgi:hypothetical protein